MHPSPEHTFLGRSRQWLWSLTILICGLIVTIATLARPFRPWQLRALDCAGSRYARTAPAWAAVTLESKAAARQRGQNAPPRAVHLSGVQSKYAVATFLAGREPWEEQENNVDNYFTAARILVYQLLYAQETRLLDDRIPLIVLVTDKVPDSQRQRLKRDGAVVIPAPGLGADWLDVWDGAWHHVMTKLRLWELVDFERIVFLDADTVLTGRIDDIFNDPAVSEEQITLSTATARPDSHRFSDSLPPMPSSYVFASSAEWTKQGHMGSPTTSDGREHDWDKANYMNAGFFVMKPDVSMLELYTTILTTPGSFDQKLPEQGLLNTVHNITGVMPWTQVDPSFNVHFPTWEDVMSTEPAPRTVHEKFWTPEPGPLRLWLEAARWRMEGFFEARDRLRDPYCLLNNPRSALPACKSGFRWG